MPTGSGTTTPAYSCCVRNNSRQSASSCGMARALVQHETREMAQVVITRARRVHMLMASSSFCSAENPELDAYRANDHYQEPSADDVHQPSLPACPFTGID